VADSNATNRRRVERRHISDIEATLRTPGDVTIVDVGLFGLGILAPAELSVGSSVCLEVRHGHQTANLEGTVCWCSVSHSVWQKGNFVPVTTAGIEFREILRDSEGGIWDWIMVPEPHNDTV
jgi:hypothetical protein